MYYLVIAIAVVIIIAIWWITTVNWFRRTEVKIDEASSGIEVALTKRYDLLTKLMDTAKGYAKHEKETIVESIMLRKGMSTEELNTAAAKMSDAWNRINLLAEAYPQLRASEVFVELQRGIEDSEEHLQAARRLFNSNVSAYNQKAVTFPASIVESARKGGGKKAFFEAEEHKRQDVKMSF